MRMQGKDQAALQFGRALFDPADRCVAIFDRKWEAACHEGRAHAFELAQRHAAGQHQPFGAAADGAMQRADANLARARGGQRLATDFNPAGADIPKRFGSLDQALFILPWTLQWSYGYILNGTRKQGDRPNHARSFNRALRHGGRRRNGAHAPAGVVCRAGRVHHGRGAVARGGGSPALQRRRHLVSFTLYRHPALVGDRLLECRHRVFSHAALPRSGRGREPARDQHPG